MWVKRQLTNSWTFNQNWTLFLGGNDLDRRHFTDDHNLFVLHNLFQAARTLPNNGIRLYVIVIQERRTPKNVSYPLMKTARGN